MKVSEFRKLIREEVRKTLKEVEVTGDWNLADFKGPAQKAAKAYLKTPEGLNAIRIFKALTSKPFSASDLTRAIKKGKFTSMNNFRFAAAAGGLDLEGLGNLDNKGTGDFAVHNSNYTDEGAAIAFFNNKFEAVG